jgi:hypothetical protein
MQVQLSTTQVNSTGKTTGKMELEHRRRVILGAILKESRTLESAVIKPGQLILLLHIAGKH